MSQRKGPIPALLSARASTAPVVLRRLYTQPWMHTTKHDNLIECMLRLLPYTTIYSTCALCGSCSTENCATVARAHWARPLVSTISKQLSRGLSLCTMWHDIHSVRFASSARYRHRVKSQRSVHVCTHVAPQHLKKARRRMQALGPTDRRFIKCWRLSTASGLAPSLHASSSSAQGNSMASEEENYLSRVNLALDCLDSKLIGL